MTVMKPAVGGARRRPRPFLARNDGDDLECSQPAPVKGPLLDKAGVITLHQLEATIEIGLDPAADIGRTIGQPATIVAKMSVGRDGVLAIEPLDNCRCGFAKRR